jgi:hypothetical protein
MRAALILVFSIAVAARAEELSSRTRQALHQALELHALDPVEAPALPQSLGPRVGIPRASEAAAQATQAASRAQTEAANQAAQDIANGRGRSGTANDASRNAAGQQRAAEAKATGGNGASHGHGPPEAPGKSSH